jgi:hypothetical protein
MAACSMMKHGNAVPNSSTPSESSSPLCVITFSPVASPRSPAVVLGRSTQVTSMVAIAPSTCQSLTPKQTPVLAIARDSYALSPRYLAAAHGLRAPPIA